TDFVSSTFFMSLNLHLVQPSTSCLLQFSHLLICFRDVGVVYCALYCQHHASPHLSTNHNYVVVVDSRSLFVEVDRGNLAIHWVYFHVRMTFQLPQNFCLCHHLEKSNSNQDGCRLVWFRCYLDFSLSRNH